MVTLSFVVPVYNCERYLASAVHSILNQPCDDYEIVIVDDGSTDNSLMISEQFAKEHASIIVIHTANHGVSHARNTGIQKTTGKYVAFLDSDDVLCRGVYDQSMADILINEQYDAISCGFITATEDLLKGTVHNVVERLMIRQEKDMNGEYVRNIWKPFTSYIYRRKLFSRYEMFPEGIKLNEDMVFRHLVLTAGKRMLSLNKPWFMYRIHLHSVTHNSKGTLHYLMHVIPAWDWCKARAPNQLAWEICNNMIFRSMIEYIEQSCLQGVPLKSIHAGISDCVPFQNIADILHNININEKKRIIYNAFLSSPRVFWLKRRMNGVIISIIRFIRIPGFWKVYQKLKYRSDIRKYIAVFDGK